MKIGEKVEGFEVYKYEEKFMKRILPGWKKPRPVDISELTLERGEKLITLVKGEDVQYNELIARLFFKVNNQEYSARVDDTLELMKKKYKIIKIDIEKEYISILDLQENKKTVLKKFPEEKK